MKHELKGNNLGQGRAYRMSYRQHNNTNLHTAKLCCPLEISALFVH